LATVPAGGLGARRWLERRCLRVAWDPALMGAPAPAAAWGPAL